MNHLAIYDVATGIVVGTTSAEIIGDPAEGFAYLDYDPAVDPRGWRVEGGELVEQLVTIAEPVRLTFNQWVDLFDLDEQVAIVTATMTDPMAKLIYDRAQSASGNIDPTDERTRQGLAYFVAKGWVSQATLDRIPQHI
jgi:hypothetical protein